MRDRIWIVETGPEPNQFVGFDPMTEEIFSVTEVPSGGGTVRHMYFDAETNAVWFGADTNTIGVAQLPPRRAATSFSPPPSPCDDSSPRWPSPPPS